MRATDAAQRAGSSTLPDPGAAPDNGRIGEQTGPAAIAARRPSPGLRPMQRPYTVCIAHRKGGVGKTTTTWYLARELARAGRRVVLRDLDPQMNLRDILRAHGAEDGRFSARIALVAERAPLPFEPDLELLDTPPLLDVSLPVLERSDAILVPVVPEFAAVRALGRMLKTIRATMADHPFLRVLGILPLRVRARWPAHGAFLRDIERLARDYDYPVLPPVPDSVAVMSFSLRGRLWRPAAERVLAAMREDGRSA
jgi:cellulose biosynthesis protein BcsQ